MDGDLYDEFGNYIGPDLESDEEEENVYGSASNAPQSRYDEDNEEEEDEEMQEGGERHGYELQTLEEDNEDAATAGAIVLHEVNIF